MESHAGPSSGDPGNHLKRKRSNSPNSGEEMEQRRGFSPSFGRDMVQILVRPEQVEFLVHKTPLMKASKFFKAAFESEFMEGVTGVLKLPEDPEIFDWIVNLVYHGSFSGKVGIIYWQEVVEGRLRGSELPMILPVYIALERYQMNDLLRLLNVEFEHGAVSFGICDEIYSRDVDISELAIWSYANSMEGSPLRNLVARIIVRALRAETIDLHDIFKLYQEIPDLACDLTEALLTYLPTGH